MLQRLGSGGDVVCRGIVKAEGKDILSHWGKLISVCLSKSGNGEGLLWQLASECTPGIWQLTRKTLAFVFEPSGEGPAAGQSFT